MQDVGLRTKVRILFSLIAAFTTPIILFAPQTSASTSKFSSKKERIFEALGLAEASQINNLCANQRSSDGKDFLVGALVLLLD
jgi:uncharacterized membrane protein